MDLSCKRTTRYLLLLAVVTGAHVCFSEEINCTALETSTGTFYVVPEFTGIDCFYSWSNSSDHVLANSGGRIDNLVIGSNSTSLHTNTCYQEIEYSRDCLSKEPKTAKCFANCTRSTGSDKVTAITTMHWAIPVTLLTIVGILCFVLIFFRRKRHLSTVVRQNYHQNQANNVVV